MPVKTFALMLVVVIAAAAVTLAAVQSLGGPEALLLLSPFALVAAWLLRFHWR